MINLDEKFHNYLGGKKHFRIDGVNEPLTGYGYNCDGSDIIGYWVNTTNYKLFYNFFAIIHVFNSCFCYLSI